MEAIVKRAGIGKHVASKGGIGHHLLVPIDETDGRKPPRAVIQAKSFQCFMCLLLAKFGNDS